MSFSSPESVSLQEANILDEVEALRARRFRYSKDKDLYVAAHIFVRKSLSELREIRSDQWKFGYSEFGKPFIENEGHQDLRFSLSHTHGMIACAISDTHNIGIDVERVRPLERYKEMLDLVLSDREKQVVLGHKSRQMLLRRFFVYWTLKEAYLKAMGSGLSMPLSDISFVQDKLSMWKFHLEANHDNRASVWRFCSYQLGYNYQVGLAVELSPGPNPF